MEASRVLAVASSLASMNPGELATVLTERGVTPSDDAHPLGVAAQLLELDAASQQLSHLSGSERERLRLARSVDRGVLSTDDSTRLLAWQRGSHLRLAPEIDDALEAAGPDDSPRLSPDQVVDVVGVLARIEKMETIIRAAEIQPVSGDTTEALRSWAASHGDEEAEWKVAADISRAVGLLAVHQGAWHQTTSASEWLAAALSERWAWILRRLWSIRPGWVDSSSGTDDAVFSSTGGWEQMASLVGVFPGGGDGSPAEVLSRGGDIDQWVSGQLPEPAEQVYADGPDTLVTAGPLPVSHERALRQIGHWLSGNVASRFQVNGQTVLRARQHGLSMEDITDAVELVVPGGVSSTLGASLIDSLQRAEQMTIQWSESGTQVDCVDSLALDLLRADRKLQSLGFQPVSDSQLASPQPVDTVHALLMSEGYPHLVVDQAGKVFDVDKARQAPVSWGNAGGEDIAVALLKAWQSWRASSPMSWWEPPLEWAIAHKLRLSAIVNINDAETEFFIEPKSLQNGRLRARDTRSDVERTIPVTHLVDIHSPEAVSAES